jgi:hypothetical protein
MINCIRWYKFKKRIHKELPKFNTKNGMKMSWRIQIVTNRKYDKHTGAVSDTSMSTLAITQVYSAGYDDSVYGFDWKKKETTPHVTNYNGKHN